MLKIVRHTAEIVVILLVSTAVLIPWFGYMAIDFSQPTDVAWRTDDKGERQEGVSYKYTDSVGECAHRFYQLIHSPIEPEYWAVIILCLLTTVGLICVSYFVINKRDDDDTFVELFVKIVPVQLFLIVICVIGFQLNNAYLNPEDMLRQSIADQELAEKVISSYMFWVYAGSWLIPLFIFLAFDLVTTVFGGLAAGGLEKLLEWPATRARQTMYENQAVIDGRVIVIHRDRLTEYLNLEWAIKWIPWPVAVLKKERLAVTSLDAFLNEIANEARRFVANSFLRHFEEVAANCLSRLNPQLVAGFAQAWQNQLARWIQTNAAKIRNELAVKQGNSAERLLTETALETAGRIKQDMSATAAEMTRQHLSGFWGGVMDQLRPVVIQNQTGLGNATPILPEGTKVFLAKGNVTVVVVEQKPQTRSVLFSGEFVNRYGGLGVVEDRPSERFNLALPYTLFVFCFVDGRLERLYFFYRNQPLGSLADGVARSNLPNVDDRGRVCLGPVDLPRSSLARQIEAAITHFWNSQFNTDMRYNFEDTAGREPRLARLKRWEAETASNPLFVLSVEWLARNSSLEQLLQGLLGDTTPVDILSVFNRVAKHSINTAANGLGEEIAGHIAGINFSGLCQRTAAKALDQELNAVGRHLVDTILANTAQTLIGEGREAEQQLTNAIVQAVPRALSDSIGREIAQGHFASQVDPWDTMLRLVPREETMNDERAADTDIHSQTR